jgi:hypothetical protein
MGGIRLFIGRFLIVALTAFNISCSKDSATVTQGDRFGLVNHGECYVSPIDGDNLPQKSLDLSYRKTGYFQKTLALGHLNSVMATSGRDTWRYITGLNIPIYKVQENPEARCRYFAALDPAPEDLKATWDGFSTDGGTLLGLYSNSLSKNTSTGEVKITDKAILVREDSERWTLVHEFSHYLYSESRTQQNGLQFPREVRDDLKVLRRKIRKLKDDLEEDPTQEKALSLLYNLDKFFEKTHQLNVQGPLEEFAIESYLLEKHSEGVLKYINVERDPTNAINYMRFNAFFVMEPYREFLGDLKAINREFISEEWPRAQRRFKELRNHVRQIMSFVEDKLDEAEAHDFSNGLVIWGMIAVDEPPIVLEQHYDVELYGEVNDLMLGL